MSAYHRTLLAASDSLTDALTRLDAQQQATVDYALAHGATLGIEAQLLPTPQLFVVLMEREGTRRVLAEILSGEPASSSLQ